MAVIVSRDSSVVRSLRMTQTEFAVTLLSQNDKNIEAKPKHHSVILSVAKNLARSGSNRKGDSSVASLLRMTRIGFAVALLTGNDTDWVCARIKLQFIALFNYKCNPASLVKGRWLCVAKTEGFIVKSSLQRIPSPAVAGPLPFDKGRFRSL